MDHLSHLPQQAEHQEAHSNPTSTAPAADPATHLPAAPSMRAVDIRQPLLRALPSLPQTVQNTLPTPAVGTKRPTVDADLEADAVHAGKRLKVSPASDPDAGRFPEVQAEDHDIVVCRERNASDASHDENALNAVKRLRMDEPCRPEVYRQAMTADREQPPVPRDDFARPYPSLPGLPNNHNEDINKTALELAMKKLDLEVIHDLLAIPGAIVRPDDARKLCRLAAETGDILLFRLMMDRPDFDVNGPGYPDSYLVLAAENGHFTVVQALLAAPGTDVNAGADKGRSALRAAIKNNHRQIAIVLAAMPDIDVNVGTRGNYHFGDYHGYTALMVAAETGNLPLVHMLLAMGTIEVNLTDKRGYTALMLAAHQGHFETVRALLAMPGIEVNGWSQYRPFSGNSFEYVFGNPCAAGRVDDFFSALSMAKLAGHRQIVDALLAMPISAEFVHRELYDSLRASSRPARLEPGEKSTASPAETYRLLCQILHPGPGADTPALTVAPQLEQLDAQRASWLEQKCMAISLGTCVASEVPFLLQLTIPLPAWCQSSLANAIALGFTAGHYRHAPAPLWQVVQETRAWLAGLAFGAKQSRLDVIELDVGICHQLESMRLWHGFLNTVEALRQLKADPECAQPDKLTLLGRAAGDGDLAAIKVLVAIGADIHLRSSNGDAPILVAAKAGQWAACAELFALGAMPVMADSQGYPVLFHIASAFAQSDTATPALARLIRYLRLKNIRFDIPVPDPDEARRKKTAIALRPVALEKNFTVLVSDILVSNPESWVRFGKLIYGVDDALFPATVVTPAYPV